MKGKSGKEMRDLMLAVSVSVLMLVIAIIAYFMVDIVVTTSANIEEDKQKLVEASVQSLQDMKSVLNMTDIAPMLRFFNPVLIEQVMGGDEEALYGYVVDIILSFYPVDYVGVVVGGELADYGTRGGGAIDPADAPTVPPIGDYETYDELFGEEGFFVSVFFPVDMGAIGGGDLYVNMIVDRTQQLIDIESYFNEQRSDLILRLSIISAVAILLSVLLTTFGLRYFTRKYVVRPIEELNLAAEEIADGTFAGEVRVDEDSAYAALQGLLRSGQKVLRHMDDEMKE